MKSTSPLIFFLLYANTFDEYGRFSNHTSNAFLKLLMKFIYLHVYVQYIYFDMYLRMVAVECVILYEYCDNF